MTLARIVGESCGIDLLIDDIREELRGRPYDLVAVAGVWKHLTRPAYADAIRAAVRSNGTASDLTQSEMLVLMCIAYLQPITRGDLSSFFSKEISRDLIGHLRCAILIASGPRSPTPGASYTYVTTKEFLLEFGLATLRDLPDFEALEDAGLLSKEKLLAGDVLAGIVRNGEADVDEHRALQAGIGASDTAGLQRPDSFFRIGAKVRIALTFPWATSSAALRWP